MSYLNHISPLGKRIRSVMEREDAGGKPLSTAQMLAADRQLNLRKVQVQQARRAHEAIYGAVIPEPPSLPANES